MENRWVDSCFGPHLFVFKPCIHYALVALESNYLNYLEHHVDHVAGLVTQWVVLLSRTSGDSGFLQQSIDMQAGYWHLLAALSPMLPGMGSRPPVTLKGISDNLIM